MRIINIFVVLKDKLYAVAFEKKKSVLTVLQENWLNPIWLEQFFEDNKKNLHSGFWRTNSVEKAVNKTREDAQLLLFKLRHATHEDIDDMFKPLHRGPVGANEFQAFKLKGDFDQSWLRIYAIHNDGKYYITGGAIKLTRAMQDCKHTSEQLEIINNVRDQLKIANIDHLIVFL